MNTFFALIVPVIFIASFLFAAVKKVKVYDSFTEGVKGAIPLVLSVFPYVAAVTMLVKLFEVSGLQARFESVLHILYISTRFKIFKIIIKFNSEFMIDFRQVFGIRNKVLCNKAMDSTSFLFIVF